MGAGKGRVVFAATKIGIYRLQCNDDVKVEKSTSAKYRNGRDMELVKISRAVQNAVMAAYCCWLRIERWCAGGYVCVECV